MRMMVLSPHRDDAAFSLSLSIGCWLQQGHTVEVLNCFTRSEYAPYADPLALAQGDRVEVVTALRLAEDERWVRALGGEIRRVDMELYDAPLRLHCSADVVCGLPVRPHDAALTTIRDAVEKWTCDALVLPLALGGHVDHLTARKASSGAGLATVCAFYEDLPYAGRPGVFEDIGRVACTIDPSLKPVFVCDAMMDAEDTRRRKEQLALCYDTQIEAAAAQEIAEYSRRHGGRERLWANDAWRRSELMFAETIL